MTYGFGDKLAEGERHEDVLDKFFSRRFVVERVGEKSQRRGIDRVFIGRRRGMRVSVEYKADSRAARSGCAFFETVSVDTDGKPGWPYTSMAQWYVLYIPPTGAVSIIDMTAIKAEMQDWVKEYAVKEIPNDGYKTLGIPVPLVRVNALARWRGNINPPALAAAV